MRRLPTLAVLTLALSCAGPATPRIIVQADAIAKSDLAGEWYFRQTVTGVPFTTGFTFIGEQGDNELEKIKWDIQENVLIARRSYEFVQGSEKGEPTQCDASQYMGAPVAAFKIAAQFDIIRDYNPSTGEEYDRIVENTERKWYDRKYIRVDWSQNLVSNFEFLADFNHGGVSAIRQDPAPYYVSDPKDPDAFRLERPASDQPANYLEVTQKIIASPESVDFEDETNVPLCFLEYATQDCASQEIKIRNSFMRVKSSDYDPLIYDDHMMERFGFFTTERDTYNRQYGETESGRKRLINRFNIWQHTLSTKTCSVDADCGDAARGERCVTIGPNVTIDSNSGQVTGRCTLPYAVRNLENPSDSTSKDLGPRPIVYYLDDHFPPELVDTAKFLEKEYNDTFKGIYKDLVGKDAPKDIFVLCAQNPVPQDDPVCGPKGTHARIGDLRYNLLMWVDEPNNADLLGYGPSSHDPETGETINGSAFLYGAGIDEYSAQARDIVRLVNGEISPDSYIDGVNVQDWVQSNLNGARHHPIDQSVVDDAARKMNVGWARSVRNLPDLKKASAKVVAGELRARNKAFGNSSALGADPGVAARNLDKIRGTRLESALANPEVLLARGLDPRTSADALDVSKVRPLSLVNPETARFMRRERLRLGSKGVDLADSFDDTAIGFALSQKGQDPQAIWKVVREAVFRSAAEHEVGHTLGLRHNFSGSFDAMNYPKTYWDLRTANGQHQPKPRYLDPETDAELQGVQTQFGVRAGISEFQTSSLMDYGARFNTDINGLGRYDKAALKFGYGQLVEVFNNVKDPYLIGELQATVTFGMPQPLLTDCSGNNWISVHYTKLPELVDLNDRTDVPFAKISNGVPPEETCAYPDPVDHDPQGRLVVPYRFCSDEFESASPDCFMFDRGADVYEAAQNWIDTYQNYYLLNNFRRDRLGFNPDDYLDRIYERYFDPLRTQMQFYALFRADYADTLDASDPFWSDPDGWGPYTIAVQNGFNLFGRVLTTPEPGPYTLFQLDDTRNGYQTDPNSDMPDMTIPVPEGKFQQTEWDYDSGYYWDERITHVGQFLDKIAALAELSDPETDFVGTDESTDLRQYAINYYRLYPQQMTDVFAAAMTDRWDQFAPVSDGTNFRYRDFSDGLTQPNSNEDPVDPAIGFSVKLYATALELGLIPGTWDPTFLDSSRVFLKGSGATVSPSQPTVEFDDPYNGLKYMAVSYKKNGVETGIGARMIERAQELQGLLDPTDPLTDAALRSHVELLEMLRTYSAAYSDLPQEAP